MKTQISFNNFSDQRAFEKDGTLACIASGLNKPEFLQALENNYTISDKNLWFHFVFLDRGHIGPLELKEPHSVTATIYADQWHLQYDNESRILFLFVREFGATSYEFAKLEVSGKLQTEHFPDIVIEFIKSHLSGTPGSVIEKGLLYLSRAIDPVWTKEKEQPAEALVKNQKYFKGYKATDEFDLSFFDFAPFSNTVVNLGSTIPVYAKVDNQLDADYLQLKSSMLGKVNLVAVSKTGTFDFYGWEIPYQLADSSKYIVINDDYLAPFINQLNSGHYHNPNHNVSEYTWNSDGSIQIDNSFIERQPNDKLEMFKTNIAVGTAFPVIAEHIKKTWCNIYARDLSRDVLFGYVPWGENECANRLHYRLNHSKDFAKVNLGEAWKLTAKGYVVYLTTFNYELDAATMMNKASENEVKEKPSGHIATCFPVENKVIQAGGYNLTKIEFYNVAWGQNYGQNRERVTANIYLGYLIK